MPGSPRSSSSGWPGSDAGGLFAVGQLGQREAASSAVRELLSLRPDAASAMRGVIGKWWWPEQVTERLLEGLRKAGLDVPVR